MTSVSLLLDVVIFPRKIARMELHSHNCHWFQCSCSFVLITHHHVKIHVIYWWFTSNSVNATLFQHDSTCLLLIYPWSLLVSFRVVRVCWFVRLIDGVCICFNPCHNFAQQHSTNDSHDEADPSHGFPMCSIVVCKNKIYHLGHKSSQAFPKSLISLTGPMFSLIVDDIASFKVKRPSLYRHFPQLHLQTWNVQVLVGDL